MESCPHLSAWLRRLHGGMLAGGCLLLLAGILIKGLAVIAVCGTVGMLMWLPLHSVFVGTHTVLRRPCAPRWWSCCRQKCRAFAEAVHQTLEIWVPAAAAALVEIVCGAIIGVMVALIVGLTGSAVGAAALLGAAAGVAVLIGRH
jgi:hypothetical protein